MTDEIDDMEVFAEGSARAGGGAKASGRTGKKGAARRGTTSKRASTRRGAAPKKVTKAAKKTTAKKTTAKKTTAKKATAKKAVKVVKKAPRRAKRA
jgi:hypothetical protein